MITTAATLTRKYDSPSGYVSFVYFQVAESFEFLEWQFVMLEAEVHGKLIKRPYSIATTNRFLQNEKEIGIIVKRTSDKWMSSRLTEHIQIGDPVTLRGPVGHYIDTQTYDNYLFVSVGSWLSPNVGLFQKLVYESHKYNKIVHIFGERYHQHIVPQVEEIFFWHEQEHVQNLLFLSQEQNVPEQYIRWYVQEGIEGALAYLWLETSCFLCGKPEMVDSVSQLLQQQGIAKEHITFEKY